jgi:hypothetical protein
MPVDLGTNLSSLGGYLAGKPGEAMTTAAQKLGQRNRGQGKRVIDVMRQAAGIADESAVEAGQAARKSMDDILAQPISVSAEDTKLLDLLKRPSLKSAWDRARLLAAEEGRSLDPLEGVIAGVKSGKIAELSTQTMHDLKKGLDDVLEPKRDPVTGIVSSDTGKNMLAAQKKNRAAFRSIIKEKNPEYGEALDAMSGEYRFTGAYEEGRKALGIEARDIVKQIKGKSSDELANYRKGYVEALADRTSKKSAKGHDITGVALDPDRLNAVFGAEQGGRLIKALEAEERMRATSNKILGGSPTTPKLQVKEDMEQGVGDIVANPPRSLSDAVWKMVQMATGATRRPPAAALDATARLLFESDPQKISQMLADMSKKSPLSMGLPRGPGMVPGTLSAEAGRQSGETRKRR